MLINLFFFKFEFVCHRTRSRESRQEQLLIREWERQTIFKMFHVQIDTRKGSFFYCVSEFVSSTTPLIQQLVFCNEKLGLQRKTLPVKYETHSKPVLDCLGGIEDTVGAFHEKSLGIGTQSAPRFLFNAYLSFLDG